MRSSSLFVALSLFGAVFAAPIADPAMLQFEKAPLSVHRRAVLPDTSTVVNDVTAGSASLEASAVPAAPTAAAVEDTAVVTAALEAPVTADSDSCSSVCGLQRVPGARSEREALCSVDGLHATLECAQCIDRTWPDTTWEDSAMAEYERIVSACDDSPQT
ncbi:hypothetical protein IAU60_000324 [Kwoniella sp. DSM 27419]